MSTRKRTTRDVAVLLARHDYAGRFSPDQFPPDDYYEFVPDGYALEDQVDRASFVKVFCEPGARGATVGTVQQLGLDPIHGPMVVYGVTHDTALQVAFDPINPEEVLYAAASFAPLNSRERWCKFCCYRDGEPEWRSPWSHTGPPAINFDVLLRGHGDRINASAACGGCASDIRHGARINGLQLTWLSGLRELRKKGALPVWRGPDL